MSYIVPKGELTLTDIRNFRNGSVEAGIKASLDLKLATAASELNVRGFENVFDVGAVLDQWRTAALAVIGTRYSVFQAVGAPYSRRINWSSFTR